LAKTRAFLLLTPRYAASALACWAVLAFQPAAAQTATPTPPILPSPSDIDSSIPWLAHLLEALKPGVDTSLPESKRALAERLSKQLEEGRAQATLDEIDSLFETSQQRSPETVDAQLLFLKARALNQLGRRDEAKQVYRDMTERFPELPEPWNNLASLEVADGRLDQARDALQMALRNDPNYAVAHENLGDLYIMLAARSYGEALRLDPRNAAALRKQSAARKVLQAPSAP
jgi:tetratricopeptide (TPR) repeat protein